MSLNGINNPYIICDAYVRKKVQKGLLFYIEIPEIMRYTKCMKIKFKRGRGNIRSFKNLKIFLSAALVLLLCCVLRMDVHAETYKGGCGTGVNWTLDSETGLLVIYGDGACKDYKMGGSPFNSYQSYIKKAVVEDGVTELGDWLFYNCDYLEEIIMGDDVTRIGEHAFYSCGGIKTISFSNSLETLEYGAFESCGLVDVVLPDSLITIGEKVFRNNFYLESIVIPDGVTSIGEYAFEYCSSLKSVVIPPSVETMGQGAFKTCSAMISVKMSEGLEAIPPSAFWNCYKLVSVNIPDTVKSIGEYAFCDTALENIRLPEGLETIGKSAFGSTNLHHLILPSTVTSVGETAFYGCNSLEKIAVLNADAVLYHTKQTLGVVGVATIYGYKGSTAETYAEKYDYSFEYLTDSNLWEDHMDYPNPFTDVVEGQYYCDPVKWAVYEGVTSGATDTTFEPDGTCTRGQIVTFLWRALGRPKASITECPFTDITSNQYYYDAVLWALENGVTDGATDTTFDPNGYCTRGQIVTFLHRAVGKPAPASSRHPFTDIQSDQYYYNAVLWAVENDVTSGTSDTTFSPGVACTRGQAVTFLYRVFS